MATSTGFGPLSTRNLFFNGDSSNYELFEVKFLSYLRMVKLHDVVANPTTGALLTTDSVDNAGKDCEVFACLVQFLDDKSLSLIIRDAKNKGRKALEILRNHYIGSTKPRIISMYCDLTTLKLQSEESVTEYLLRGETTRARLDEAGEKVSDSLLIAMLLKGLPESFKSFSTVIIQQDVDKLNFEMFKNSLKNYDENERARVGVSQDQETVMKISSNNKAKPRYSTAKLECYSCGSPGHVRQNCTDLNKYCNNCKTRTHNTIVCKRKSSKYSSTKSVATKNSNNDDDDFSSFVFVVNDNECSGIDQLNKSDNKNLDFLVDCGATAHIINDESLFVSFDQNFSCETHTIELADSSSKQGIVKGRGDAVITLTNVDGLECDITVKDALFIPSYNQNILSVQSITKRGACVNFGPGSATITTPDKTKFEISQKGRLYYVNTVKSHVSMKRNLKNWHETLGHCNFKDILKLEKVVEGMQISDKSDYKCVTCIEGKMTQYRNHKADEKATRPWQ